MFNDIDYVVRLPTFHPGQLEAWKKRTRFFALRCGRRWGKTDMGSILAGDAACKGRYVGVFVPSYKVLTEVYAALAELLVPIIATSSKSEWVIRLVNGGRIDFWSLENERAGRSRKYDLVLIDEAAFTKPNMIHVWETAIRPTLIDRHGCAVAMSTPNGVNDENFFYNICTEPKKYGFTEFHAPTAQNPYLPVADVKKLIYQYQPLVYKQEILAEFVNWGDTAFFDVKKMLLLGEQPLIVYPQHVEYVCATIDTAVKDGQENDGTAVVYWAYNEYGNGPKITLLDWDILQINASLLIDWLPGVYLNLEELAKKCQARYGTVGTFIEDKMSGTVLLQQALSQGMMATPIPSNITDKGKDGRAVGISAHYFQEKIKIHHVAWDKTKDYKGKEKNHLIDQISKFYLSDKEAYKRSDDLLDAFVYGPAVMLGTGEDLLPKAN
jgi:hypothetical protein